MITINRRRLMKLVSVGFLGAVAAACAPAVPTPTPVQPTPTPVTAKPAETPTPAAKPAATPTSVPQKPAAKAKVKIVAWGENAPEKYRPLILNEFVKTFNDAHPDVELEYQFTQDLDRVLRTAMQAGAGPDIVITPGPAFVLEYVNAGFIRPLDDYSRQFGWRDKIQRWAYDASTVGGKLWSVPLTFETLVLFYNKTLFQQKGWKPPTTRSEMETIAEAAAKDKIWPFAHSNSFWKGVNEWMISIFYNNYAGADKVYQALTGKLQWTEKPFAESTALIVEYCARKGWFSGSLENYFSLSGPDKWGAFAQGKAAMNMEGTWAFQAAPQYFTTSKQEWDWVPIPALQTNVVPVYPLAIGTTVSINAKSPNPDAAALVLDWLYADKKRAARIARGYDFAEWVVPLKFTREDFPPDTDERMLRYIDAFNKAVNEEIFGYTTWSFWPAKTDQVIIQDLDLVLAGKMTVDEYQKKQQETFAQELKEGKVPPIPEPRGLTRRP